MKPRSRILGLAAVALMTTGLARARQLLAQQDIPTMTQQMQDALGKEIIGPKLSMTEVMDYLEPRIPSMPKVESARQWQRASDRLRKDMLDKVVFRGEAKAWRDAQTRVEWLDTLATNQGYHLKKLRYEALPGMWIPALLYEPDRLEGKVPAILNVNGHDPKGKQAEYKQIRCINMAKRGMLALNLEWFGMGQLRTPGFSHRVMNQLDLCGASGLAPFYLNMKRGLDVLLAHPNADLKRVGVTGLSGGGWQTIMFSALETRVTLSNPVAGYSSFKTRIRYHKDLGDSEQTPCDMATVADYTHLTAMLAPRPTLLTYNAKDDCCFEAGYALPPLLEAALPLFKLFGKETALRSHVNEDPGTHNYLLDNRQAHYRLVRDFFYEGRLDANEIPSDAEVKTAAELEVPLPPNNTDFNGLAQSLARELPRDPSMPRESDAPKWRARLRSVTKPPTYTAQASKVGEDAMSATTLTRWKLKLGGFTVPAVELRRAGAQGTTIVVADAGRRAAATHVEQLLSAGQRVLVVDPWYLGETKFESYGSVGSRDYLWALLILSIGERPLGIQAGQLIAIAKWAQAGAPAKAPVTIRALGPRTSTMALVAAALETKAIGRLELARPLGSLKEVIEKNQGITDAPELLCYGLLAAMDLRQMIGLVAPRPVQVLLDRTARIETASGASAVADCACR